MFSRFSFEEMVGKLSLPIRTSQVLLTYSVALVRKLPIPTERPPLVGEVSANFCGIVQIGIGYLRKSSM
jgi:hypothetical protein